MIKPWLSWSDYLWWAWWHCAAFISDVRLISASALVSSVNWRIALTGGSSVVQVCSVLCCVVTDLIAGLMHDVSGARFKFPRWSFSVQRLHALWSGSPDTLASSQTPNTCIWWIVSRQLTSDASMNDELVTSRVWPTSPDASGRVLLHVKKQLQDWRTVPFITLYTFYMKIKF